MKPRRAPRDAEKVWRCGCPKTPENTYLPPNPTPGQHGQWPPVVDLDTWRAVQAILNNPERKKGPVYASPLLLAGIATCGVCGQKIQSGGMRAGQPEKRRYRCTTTKHVTRLAAPVDRYVEDVMVGWLQRPEVAAHVTPDTRSQVDLGALRAEAAEVNRKKDQLAVAFADGAVTLSQLRAANRRLDARLAEVEAKVPMPVDSRALASLVTAKDVRAAWEALSIEAQRTVVDQVLRVTLLAPGMPQFAYIGRYNDGGQRLVNPETVRVEFR